MPEFVKEALIAAALLGLGLWALAQFEPPEGVPKLLKRGAAIEQMTE